MANSKAKEVKQEMKMLWKANWKMGGEKETKIKGNEMKAVIENEMKMSGNEREMCFKDTSAYL